MKTNEEYPQVSTGVADATIPSSLSFTDEEIAQSDLRAELNDGWYRFSIVKSERAISVNAQSKNPGSFLIKLQAVPLRDPNDGASGEKKLLVFHTLTLPKKNPSFPEHVVPKTAGLVRQFVYAVTFGDGDNEISKPPAKVNGAWMHNGSPIEEDEALQIIEDSNEKFKAYLSQLWENPQMLIDAVFYASASKDSNTGFMKLNNLCGCLPEDAQLTTSEEFQRPQEVIAKPAPVVEKKAAPKKSVVAKKK